MLTSDTQSWFIKWGFATALPLFACYAVSAIGMKAPPLPADQNGSIAVLAHYTQEPPPDIVLVGSSLTARLREDYFDNDHLKVIGLSGGSAITGLEVLLGQSRMPKIVLVEMNILERDSDPALIKQFTETSRSFQLQRPIKSAVALYERWLHAPRDRKQARAAIETVLQQQPGTLDNHVFAELATREWARQPSPDQMKKNVEILQRLIAKIEMRGGLVYFYRLPYPKAIQDSNYAAATDTVANATFGDQDRWLHLCLPLSELRWPDSIHLNERSSIIVAREIQRVLAYKRSDNTGQNEPLVIPK